jgi:hypothetical protein
MTNLEDSGKNISLDVFFSPAYASAAAEFDTTRKSSWPIRCRIIAFRALAE